MKLMQYQINAFSHQVFSGNPAAVVPLDRWFPDAIMQAIAEENHLSETTFYVPAKNPGTFHLRWFTPVVEVDLCGHAPGNSACALSGTRISGRRDCL